MADMYSYNGVKLAALPSFPTGCSYAIIFYDTEDDRYYLFCSSEKFVRDGDNFIIPATATYGGYAAKAGASSWSAARFTPNEDTADPDYYIVANTGNITWSGVDICQKDTETVVYQATTPLQYPTITSFTGSSKSYNLNSAAEAMECTAQVNDGGTLSYSWQEGETEVGTGTTFTPPTDTKCTKTYRCVVTNTTGGTTLQTVSSEVTIKVAVFFDIKTFCTFLSAALCSRAHYHYVAPDPLCLYNGVQLVDINTVWTDKETYPYAVISDAPGFVDSGFVYQLMISSSPTEITSSGTRYHVSNAVAKDYMIFVYNEEIDSALQEEVGISLKEYAAMAFGMELDVWTLVQEYDNYEAGFAIDSCPTRWANHDILSEDGTVYLAASDPIPV